MLYRRYGKTGEKVSLLGFGGMRFGENEEEGAAAMLHAYELGVTLFDTAPFYCRDRSLDIFGKALPHMDRKRILVSSKSGIGSDKDEAAVRRHVEEMLKRMKIDYLDILYMWCIFDLAQYRAVTAPGGPFEGALKLKEEGIVRHVAFSAHAPTEEIKTMCAEGLFEGALLSFNIINHRARIEGLKAARKMGMGVVVMNPLGGGLIPRLAIVPARSSKAPSAKASKGTAEDLVRGALRFVASHEEVTCLLSGMKSPAEVEFNVRAIEETAKSSREETAAIEERLGSLGEDFCTLCRYCVPCPEGIDIPAFMAAYNMIEVGMADQARAELRFRRSRTWADRCSACGECEEKCTQQLDIIERLKEITRRFGKKY